MIYTNDHIVNEIKSRSAYALSRQAEVEAPDSKTSAGADFLDTVRGAVLDQVQFHAIKGGEELSTVAERLEEDAWEIATSAVPEVSVERWDIFRDLAAWTEDVSDILNNSKTITGLSDLAGLVLYGIADRLVRSLLRDIKEEGEGVYAKRTGDLVIYSVVS